MNTATPTPQAEHSAEAIAASFAEADAPKEDLSGHSVEDWICLGFFWLMCGLVFLQFFTRYVLNNSFAWTEELAVYCLIPVVFIGSAMCVHRSRHIHVNFLYRYLPGRLGRFASTFVDIVCAVFYASATWLIARFTLIIGEETMTTIAWSKGYVYWLACTGMALMALRAVQQAVVHARQGYSVLERPEAYE
jgi:TRAP-type C4-dicarboxylate transport system permease small subunit